MTKTVWEKSPQFLIDAFYMLMNEFPQAELRKMFGYPCAFLNGNMFVGLHEGNMAVRVPADFREHLLISKKGSIFAPMKGRVMKEYIALASEIIADPPQLKSILESSYQHVLTLPPKAKKVSAKRKNHRKDESF